MEGINFAWTGSGFGNALALAHLTKICNDNDVPAVFTEHKTTRGLVDVPLYSPKEHSDYYLDTWKGIRNTYWKKNVDEPSILQYVRHVSQLVEKRLIVDERHNHIPVTFKPMDVPFVDVVMCTKSGHWGPYRDWPYFQELKGRFDGEGISYIDCHEKGIYSHECLNYVNNAKLYLGLETGMSHYVSKFANGKALIIQSGFCTFYYWAGLYDYDVIKYESPCIYRPCFIDRDRLKQGIECTNDVSCMRGLSVDMVFNSIMEKLK